jgi:hypothetical protein
MSNIPTMSGMAQVIMSVPTDAELDAAAEVPRTAVMSGSAIKMIENVGENTTSTARTSDPMLRLSKNQ